VSKRAEVLELAVLGLLAESPLHGYELRKRLSSLLGAFRAFSYGSLYPCLKELLAAGLIAADESEPRAAGLASARAKIVYRITADGKERFAELLAAAGPSAWEDENFGIHFAFFGKTDAAVRMRILQGRRSRLEERLATVRAALTRTWERWDRYTLELQRHGLESVEREVRWLDELIETERAARAPRGPSPATDQAAGPSVPPSPVNEQ
jgi:DNA-binding PadR family transcriptional regulator